MPRDQASIKRATGRLKTTQTRKQHADTDTNQTPKGHPDTEQPRTGRKTQQDAQDPADLDHVEPQTPSRHQTTKQTRKDTTRTNNEQAPEDR